jgi:hypothetical protein
MKTLKEDDLKTLLKQEYFRFTYTDGKAQLLHEIDLPCFFWGAEGASSSEDKPAASILTTPSPVAFPLISESNIASDDTSFTEIVH